MSTTYAEINQTPAAPHTRFIASGGAYDIVIPQVPAWKGSQTITLPAPKLARADVVFGGLSPEVFPGCRRTRYYLTVQLTSKTGAVSIEEVEFHPYNDTYPGGPQFNPLSHVRDFLAQWIKCRIWSVDPDLDPENIRYH